MNRYANGDGTYNGVRMLADLTGLSEREIAWTAARVKQLIVTEKRTRDEAVAMVKVEAKARPWEPAS